MYKLKQKEMPDGNMAIPASERIKFLQEEHVQKIWSEPHFTTQEFGTRFMVVCEISLTIIDPVNSGLKVGTYPGVGSCWVNASSSFNPYESAMTIACGRACALAGIGIDDNFASADELPEDKPISNGEENPVFEKSEIATAISESVKTTKAPRKVKLGITELITEVKAEIENEVQKGFNSGADHNDPNVIVTHTGSNIRRVDILAEESDEEKREKFLAQLEREVAEGDLLHVAIFNLPSTGQPVALRDENNQLIPAGETERIKPAIDRLMSLREKSGQGNARSNSEAATKTVKRDPPTGKPIASAPPEMQTNADFDKPREQVKQVVEEKTYLKNKWGIEPPAIGPNGERNGKDVFQFFQKQLAPMGVQIDDLAEAIKTCELSKDWKEWEDFLRKAPVDLMNDVLNAIPDKD